MNMMAIESTHSPKRQRHQRRDHQDDDQVVVELVPEQRQEARTRTLVQFVGAVLAQSGLGILLGQPQLQVRAKLTDELIDRFAVRFLVVHVPSPPGNARCVQYRQRSSRGKLEPCDGCDYETGTRGTDRDGWGYES